MKRIFVTFLGISTIALAADNTRHDKKSEKPNVIVILADDMGYSDIGSYGSEIHTPHIDRLASEGIRFTQFYNAARCCPTRAALLTGMYHHRAGMGGMTGTGIELPAYQGYINDESMTMGEVFQSGGYKTYLSGKWHVGDAEASWPANRGFDESFCVIGGAADYFDPYKGDYKKIKMVRNREQYIPPDSGFYMTDVISEQAVDFIGDHVASDPETPFLLYLAYTAPHWPLQAPAEDIERYSATYRVGWDSIRLNRYKRMQQLGIIDKGTRLTDRDETVPAWDSLTGEEQSAWARKMAVYAAMVDRMDQGIGSVLDVLDKKGISENTIVIFLSDNGGCMELAEQFGKNQPGSDPGGPGSFISYEANWANASNTPFRYFKHWMHEGGIATPFIIRYPEAVTANSWRHAPAHIIDVVPTLMAYTGVNRPETYRGKALKPMDGKSLVPVLEGDDRTVHEALYWEHLGFRAVRKGDWKLVSTFPDEKWALYNLQEDRSETTDLSAAFPDKVTELDKLYVQWAERSEVMPWKEARKYRRRRNN